MAVIKKDYPIKIDIGIWCNKDNSKYLLFFQYQNKLRKKVLNYTYKDWNKKFKDRASRAEMLKIKTEIDNKFDIQSKIILNDYVKDYFKMQVNSEYMRSKENYYNNHLKDTFLGKMKLTDIIAKNIKEVLFNKKDMSERTKKTAVEILNPIFKEAIQERICIYNPCDNIKFKLPKKKKIILNATDALKNLIEAVETLFVNDDFNYCLFSFYIQGRRKSEVLKLEWKNIDLVNNFYVIEDVKNGENQKFFLSENIRNRIEAIPKINNYVFSSNTGVGHIKNIRATVKRVSNYLGIEFTLKDTRNIITSSMGENGENAIFQSGTLGHKSLKTIDKYSTLNYEVGSKKASDLIDKISQ